MGTTYDLEALNPMIRKRARVSIREGAQPETARNESRFVDTACAAEYRQDLLCMYGIK
jgi:hypothetical protein